MTGIVLKVGADHSNCVVKLKVYTNAGKWSEFTATVPETDGGAATQFCQEQLGRGTHSPAELAEACRGCCLQEVPYVGRVEGGRCVCRR